MRSNRIAYPNQLTILRQVVADYSRETGLVHESTEEKDLASRVMLLYEGGTQSWDSLMKCLRANAPATSPAIAIDRVPEALVGDDDEAVRFLETCLALPHTVASDLVAKYGVDKATLEREASKLRS